MNDYKMMPKCVGEHEPGHPVCDGAPDRPTCAHREICTALQFHVIRRKTKPLDYVKHIKDRQGGIFARPRFATKTFDSIILSAIKKRKEETIIVRNPSLLKKKEKLVRQKSKKSHWTGNQALLNSWFDEFFLLLAKWTQIKTARLAVEAFPGELYVRDYRNEGSSHVALYVRGKPDGLRHGYDFPIIRIKFRTRELKYDICFPLEVTGFTGISEAKLKLFKLRRHFAPSTSSLNKNRIWKSESFRASRAQLMAAAEILSKLIKNQVIRTEK